MQKVEVKSVDELANAVAKRFVEKVLVAVAKDVQKEIDESLESYYDEYDPSEGKDETDVFYRRTYQLRNSCKIGKVTHNGDKLNIDVFIDIDSLHYEDPHADPYKTVRAAQAGLHGGWDYEEGKKVSWKRVASANFRDKIGPGTQIWSEPMGRLFDDGKLIQLFVKHARKYGLNIIPK